MKLITPNEIITTHEGNYWRTDGRLYIPEEKEVEEPIVLSPENIIVQEIAGYGKVVKEKRGLAVVREPTFLDKVREEVVGTLRNLANPRKLAYAVGVACAILAPVAYADDSPVEIPQEGLGAKGHIEFLAGNVGLATDLIVSMDDLLLGIDFTTRYKTGVDCENQVSHFGLIDLNYNIVDGLDALLEVQFIQGVGVVPRPGFWYATAFDDVNMFISATVGPTTNPDGELHALLAYKPELTEGAKLLLQMEAVTNFAKEHNFSTQDFRIGVILDDTYMLGAAANLKETGMGNGLEFSYNAGVFGGFNF